MDPIRGVLALRLYEGRSMGNEQLSRLADEYYGWTLRAQPIVASLRGIHDYDTEFGEYSREAEDRKISELRDFAARAAAVPAEGLDASDAVTREVLIFAAETGADQLENRLAEFFVSHTSGIHVQVPAALLQFPIETVQHAEDFIERFTKSPEAFAEFNQRLAEGVANGRTPMASTAQKAVEQLDSMLEAPIDQDPFLAVRPPPGLDEGVWRSRLVELVRGYVRPALQTYRDMIASEVVPAGRSDDQPGLSWLADGEEVYARLVRQHTSLPLNPDKIHQIGLAQVERLDEEYRELGAEVLGTTDLGEIYSRLRDDPELHFETGAEVVQASEVALGRAKSEMANWFGRLPDADCLVKETPMGPSAFYFPPTVDGSRPGTFFVNTADPTRWGRFEIESMAFHEGIPGHHLQFAISQELEDVPQFRKMALITVYAEGWGLYSERLADEMGLFSGPMERIGMLSNDSLRAGRLVVDTGIHARGWTRQQAIDYFLENSPMTRSTIEGEVDRYVMTPGQALAYMIGRLEIMRMRAAAEAELGARFDIKGFHDTVLGSGLVPMETLGRMVEEWAGTLR